MNRRLALVLAGLALIVCCSVGIGVGTNARQRDDLIDVSLGRFSWSYESGADAQDFRTLATIYNGPDCCNGNPFTYDVDIADAHNALLPP